MAARPPLALVVLAFLAYVSLGLPDAAPGVAWPAVRETFGRPISSLGALLVTSVAGYLLASAFSGRLVQRLGVGVVLAGSGALVAGGMVGYALAPAWEVMVGFALLAGLGAGAIDASLNVYAAHRFRPRLIVWLHGCWGIGAVAGPLIMAAAMAGSPQGWRWGYGLLAGLIGAMTLGFLLTVRRWDEDDGNGGDPPLAGEPAAPATVPFAVALRRRGVWMNVAQFFVYTGLEISVGAWVTSLMAESRGVPRAQAGQATALYFGSITAARFVVGSFANRVPSETIVRCCTVAAPLLLLPIWLTRAYGVNLAALMLLGACLAPLFPLWTSLTPQRLGATLTVHAVGLQMAAGALGMSLIPGLLGYVARGFGLEALPIAFIGLSLLLVAIHEVARRSGTLERA
jgi:fucose permease